MAADSTDTKSPNEADTLAVRDAANVEFSIMVVALSWGAFFVLNTIQQRIITAVTELIAIVLIIPLWVWVRRDSRDWVSKVVIHSTALISTAAMAVVALASGGVDSAAIWFLGGVPMFIGYLLGPGAVPQWAVIVTVGYLVVYKLSDIPGLQEFTLPAGERLFNQWALMAALVAITVAARKALDARNSELAKHQRELQAQALELEKARDNALAAARTKSEFLALMSHELRTPLNSVVGLSGLLSHSSLSHEQQTYVDAINTSGRALQALIGDILDFSKLEAGKVELEKTEVVLSSLLDEVAEIIASQTEAKKQDLIVIVEKNAPDRFESDPARLRQILVNLLSNASKFSDEGEVILRVSSETHTQTDVIQTVLCCSVTDYGIGIPKEKLASLFQAFKQVDAATTRKYGGTGLGLALCANLLQQMGGSISVQSEEKLGSTFSFRLPIETVKRPFSKLPLTGKRIVCYSKSQNRLQALLFLVDRLGAVSSVVGGPADLLLLDLLAPDSHALIQQYSQLPVVVLLAPQQQRNDALASCLCIHRPIRFSAIASTLYDCLLGQQRTHDSTPDSLESLDILVAEDFAPNQLVAKAMLSNLGHRVTVVENGQLALDLLEKQSFDVVFLDVQMPVLDGLSTARAMVERWPQHRPYIVALTANALIDDKQACFAAGMDAFLSKPFQLADLRAILDQRFTTVQGRGSTTVTLDKAQSLVANSQNVINVPLSAVGTTMTPPAILDENLLREYLVVPGLLADIVDAFGPGVEEEFTALAGAITKKDGAGVVAHAHKIRGAAAQVGAVQVQMMAQKTENDARQGTLPPSTFLPELRQAIQTAKKALAEVVAKAAT